MPKTELKSLAHPEWPYEGTPHEWRGFVSRAVYDETLYQYAAKWIKDRDERDPYVAEGGRAPTREQIKHALDAQDAENAVYQKQNFGPELK